MPTLSRYMIRTALIYLLLGFTIGGLLLTHKGIPFYPQLWRWLPIHIQFLLFGWIVQLVMGVAFWILPRTWAKPRRPRATLAWIAYILLNVGIWLIVVATLWDGQQNLRLLGQLVELSAFIFFIMHVWRRIVSRDRV